VAEAVGVAAIDFVTTSSASSATAARCVAEDAVAQLAELPEHFAQIAVESVVQRDGGRMVRVAAAVLRGRSGQSAAQTQAGGDAAASSALTASPKTALAFKLGVSYGDSTPSKKPSAR